MKPAVYLETTMISYLAARPSRDLIVAAHQQITHRWWEKRRDDFDLFVSELVRNEAQEGDPDAARRRLMLVESCRVLGVDSESVALGDALVAGAAIAPTAAADALHVALAQVRGFGSKIGPGAGARADWSRIS